MDEMFVCITCGNPTGTPLGGVMWGNTPSSNVKLHTRTRASGRRCNAMFFPCLQSRCIRVGAARLHADNHVALLPAVGQLAQQQNSSAAYLSSSSSRRITPMVVDAHARSVGHVCRSVMSKVVCCVVSKRNRARLDPSLAHQPRRREAPAGPCAGAAEGGKLEIGCQQVGHLVVGLHAGQLGHPVPVDG